MALYVSSNPMAWSSTGLLTLPRQYKCGGSMRRRRCIVSASIGFSTDPRIQIEKAAGNLLKDVAALLVYQEVFRCPPAQAFLKLLLVLRRRDDDLKIFEAYGEFLRLMASCHHPSWEDFLLEGILKAEGNVFAEAAAGIGNPSSNYGGEVPPSLEAAAISDLEGLQRLSVNEATLAGWVAELVSDTKPEWRSAAASNLSCRTVPKFVSASEHKSNVLGFDLGDSETAPSDENGSCSKTSQADNIEKRVISKETDFVISEREKWQKKIGGLWKWSEAVPSLKQYYADYGFGRVASSQVVKWKAGKLTPDFKYLKSFHGPDLSVMAEMRAELLDNLKSFVSRAFPPRHVLVHGPPGSGKSWLLKSALYKVSGERSLRILILPSSDIKQLATVLEEVRKNFNVSFVVVIEDLFLRAVEENYLLLKSMVDEQLEEWPNNVLLCATSTRSHIKVGDGTVHLADIFGLPIELRKLDEHQYLTCVEEFLEHKSLTATSDSIKAKAKDELQREALTWGQPDKLDIRSAARFIDNVLVKRYC